MRAAQSSVRRPRGNLRENCKGAAQSARTSRYRKYLHPLFFASSLGKLGYAQAYTVAPGGQGFIDDVTLASMKMFGKGDFHPQHAVAMRKIEAEHPIRISVPTGATRRASARVSGTN